MRAFWVLGTVTGVSQTVLILPTLEECHIFLPQDTKVQRGHPVQVDSRCLPTSANCAVPAPFTAVLFFHQLAPLWPSQSSQNRFTECVTRTGLFG